MDNTIWLMDMDGCGYQVIFFAWIWMDMDLLNLLSMDIDGYGFYKLHPCQSLTNYHSYCWANERHPGHLKRRRDYLPTAVKGSCVISLKCLWALGIWGDRP